MKIIYTFVQGVSDMQMAWRAKNCSFERDVCHLPDFGLFIYI